jgi:hypothetical protein
MTSAFPVPPQPNAPLFASAASWISPEIDDDQGENPPPATGEKVILSDTDHIWGIGGSRGWVWKTLMRGANPWFMDPCVTAVRLNSPAWPAEDAAPSLPTPCPASEWEDVRLAMGRSRALADRVDLAKLQPMEEVCSTHYCLAAPGTEYLVFAPLVHRHRRRLLGALSRQLAGEPFTLDLTAAVGPADVEWVDTERGLLVPGEPIAGGGQVELRAPFASDAVLHVRVRGRS